MGDGLDDNQKYCANHYDTFHSRPDGTLYAIGLNSTVFTSTNNGVNWTALPGTPPADTNYTSLSISSSGMFFGTNQVNGGVFSYASGAFTKFTKSMKNNTNTQAPWVNDLQVDPTGLLWAALEDQGVMFYDPVLKKWTATGTLPNSGGLKGGHPNKVMGLTFDSATSSVFACTLGGVWTSTYPAATTWKTTWILAPCLTIYNDGNGAMFAGLVDGTINSIQKSSDHGVTWISSGSSIGYDVVGITAATINGVYTVLAAANDPTNKGVIRASTDGVGYFYSPLATTPVGILGKFTTMYSYLSTVDQSLHYLVGGQGALRSDDNGVTWVDAGIPSTSNSGPNATNVTSDNTGVVYVATKGYGVSVYDPVNLVFNPLTTQAGVNIQPALDILGLNTTLSGEVLAGQGEFNNGQNHNLPTATANVNIWNPTAATWTAATGITGCYSINLIHRIYTGTNPGIILVGCANSGIFYSTDTGGHTYKKASGGPGDVYSIWDTNSGVIYASGAASLYNSFDNGKTWTKYAVALPTGGTNDLSATVNNLGEVIVGDNR